jgi:hypothetical protein
MRQFERPDDRIVLQARLLMSSARARRTSLLTPRPALDARFRNPWGVTRWSACVTLSAGRE